MWLIGQSVDRGVVIKPAIVIVTEKSGYKYYLFLWPFPLLKMNSNKKTKGHNTHNATQTQSANLVWGSEGKSLPPAK